MICLLVVQQSFTIDTTNIFCSPHYKRNFTLYDERTKNRVASFCTVFERITYRFGVYAIPFTIKHVLQLMSHIQREWITIKLFLLSIFTFWQFHFYSSRTIQWGLWFFSLWFFKKGRRVEIRFIKCSSNQQIFDRLNTVPQVICY